MVNLSAAADIGFWDGDSQILTEQGVTDVDDGKNDFAGGSQTATLTIARVTSSKTYTCGVTANAISGRQDMSVDITMIGGFGG